MTSRLAVLAILASFAAGVTARADDRPPACTDDARLDRPAKKDAHVRASARDYLGKTAAALVKARGEPSCKSKTKWRYDVPDGCAYERDVVTVWFAGGKVRRVNIVHVFTGEECRFDQ